MTRLPGASRTGVSASRQMTNTDPVFPDQDLNTARCSDRAVQESGREHGVLARI